MKSQLVLQKNPQTDQNVTEEEIIKYYDDCEIDYKWVWHLDGQYAMHYGYWEKDTKKLRDALELMNVQVESALDLQDDCQILDAGCGVGGTARFLAKRHKVAVTGISLSEKQIHSAQKISNAMSLQGKNKFLVKNYCETGFADHSYDRIYGIESICHANNKAEFLQEAYRLLKPGGKLVVTDFFICASIHEEEDMAKMKKWAHTWAVPQFEKIDRFEKLAKEEGFIITDSRNITSHILKSAKRLYMMFYPGIISHHVLAFLGIRNKTQERNVWSTYYQYKYLKENLWQYNLIKMEKPSS